MLNVVSEHHDVAQFQPIELFAFDQSYKFTNQHKLQVFK